VKAEIAKTLFEKAAARLDAAGRWSLLAVLALLLVHIFTYAPYLDARQALTQTLKQKNTLREITSEMEALGRDLAQFQETARTRIEKAVDALLDAKIKDFEVLNRRVEELKSHGDDLSSSSQSSRSSRHLQIQTAPERNSDSSRLPPLDTELAEKVRTAPDNAVVLRQILRPYIEKQIIRPRFKELNQRLGEQVTPFLLSRIEDIRKMSQKIEPQLIGLQPRLQAQENLAAELKAVPAQKDGGIDWENLWQDLSAALEESEAALRDLSMQPPENDDWWISVQTKANTLAELGSAAVNQLRGQEAAAVASALNQKLKLSLERQGQLEQNLSETLRTLEEQFADQQKQLQALGQPFEWVALDLERAADLFPVLLALLLSAVSLTRSCRMRQIALALHLLPENTDIWSWFYRRTTGSVRDPFGVAPGLVELICALLWISIAIWQMEEGAVGIPALSIAYTLPIVAFLYRLWVFHEAQYLRNT